MAKSTEPAWLAYVRVGTSPSKAGSVEKIEAVDLAKNNFQELILPQELVVNMIDVLQTQIVFNNILIISSNFFFKSLHICQRQFLFDFFLKIHRVSKVRFMRFY